MGSSAVTILGLNHSNDAAAALVRNGQVVAAATEERFSRKKHDGRFPSNALDYVLTHSENDFASCDAVGFFWNPILHMDAPNRRLVESPRNHLEYLFSVPNQLLMREGGADSDYVSLRIPRVGRKPLEIFYVSHHLAHAAHAFFETPHEKAAILTVDGYGERVSTMICVGEGSEIRQLRTVPFPHSVGSVFAAFTQYLGFRPNSGEGKLMGLAETAWRR